MSGNSFYKLFGNAGALHFRSALRDLPDIVIKKPAEPYDRVDRSCWIGDKICYEGSP